MSEEKNLWDVTKVDTSVLPKDIDLCVYGFPCQDISACGKMSGFTDEDGNRTRSGLFFEALRIIEGTKPRIAIAENVKNLTGKKFKNEFELVLKSLEEAGYNNYWKVLNAKDFGIPQNRERVFIISIRKDIDNGRFEFPKPFPLERRLKDMLEDEVDESFYLSEDKIKSIANWKAQQKPFEHVNGRNSIVQCLTARGAGLDHSGMVTYSDSLENTTNIQLGIDKSNNNPKIIDVANCITAIEDRGVSNHRGEGTAIIEVVGNYMPSGHDASRIVSADGLAPTVKENHGTVTAVQVNEPMALDEQNGYIRKDGCVGTLTTDGSSPKHNNRVIEPNTAKTICLNAKGGRNGVEGLQPSLQDRVYSSEGITPACVTSSGFMPSITDGVKVRKLTPKECWRLMGFADEDFARAEECNSNTQLYKQAGNSIVVDVLCHLFKSLEEADII